MGKNSKPNKGITLIALVVTIIVLLILSGVSINFIFGNDGIFTKTQYAVEKYQNAQEEEQAMVNEIVNYMDENYSENTKVIIYHANNGKKDIIKTVYGKVGENVDLDFSLLSLYDNYLFVGWSESSTATNATYTQKGNKEITVAGTDINLYAVWEEINYNDWITWLNTAGIEDTSSYNENSIYTSEGLMENIMNNNTAVEYMVKSKTILSKVIDTSTQAYSKLNTSNIITRVPNISSVSSEKANIIYNGFAEDYTDEWGHNAYWLCYYDDNNNETFSATLTAGENTVGSWIGYDFKDKVKIFFVDGKIRMRGYKIQYTDDANEQGNLAETAIWSDATWNNVSAFTSPCNNEGNYFSTMIDDNIGAHRFWRLYINSGPNVVNWGAMVWELQFYGT